MANALRDAGCGTCWGSGRVVVTRPMEKLVERMRLWRGKLRDEKGLSYEVEFPLRPTADQVGATNVLKQIAPQNHAIVSVRHSVIVLSCPTMPTWTPQEIRCPTCHGDGKTWKTRI